MTRKQLQPAETQMAAVPWGTIAKLMQEIDTLTSTVSRAAGEKVPEPQQSSRVIEGRWTEWRDISAYGQPPIYREVHVCVTKTGDHGLKFEWVEGPSDWATWIAVGLELHNALVRDSLASNLCGLQAWFSWSEATWSDGHSQLTDAWDLWTDCHLEGHPRPQALLEFFRFEHRPLGIE